MEGFNPVSTKYVIKTFQHFYKKEKTLISFNSVKINFYGEIILGGLEIIKSTGDKFVTINDEVYIDCSGNTFASIILKFSKEEYEEEVIEDLATAELIFEAGD